MSKCSQTNTPLLNLEQDECNGKKTSTKCVVHNSPLIELNLPTGATQEEINNALLQTIVALNIRIETLEQQNNGL